MSASPLRRRLLAAPVALTIAVMSALALATPAVAATDTLVVTTPTAASTPTSRTFDVTGTGTDGSIVLVLSDAPVTLLGKTVVAGGQWAVPVTFAPEAATAQTLHVAQGDPASPDSPLAGEETIAITLPAASTVPPAGVITIVDPVDGAVLPSRDVTYLGTAPAGAFVSATLLGQSLAGIRVDTTGKFALPVTFPPLLGAEQTVTFTGTDSDGAPLAPVELTVTLPTIPAPMIQSPTPDTKGTGATITFSGTGVAGGLVGLAILPTDAASLAALAGVDTTEIDKPIAVDADGNWSATYTLAYGNFAVTAAHVAQTADGKLEIISQLTTPPVTFSLVAPVALAVSMGSTGPAVLAETGAPVAPALSAAALLLAAGGALLLARRRRISTEA